LRRTRHVGTNICIFLFRRTGKKNDDQKEKNDEEKLKNDTKKFKKKIFFQEKIKNTSEQQES